MKCVRCYQPIAIGHRCASDVVCKCGASREAIVTVIDERGAVSEVQPCDICRRQLHNALTTKGTQGSK